MINQWVSWLINWLTTWQGTVFLQALVVNGLAAILIKKVSSSLARTKKLCLQFFICFVTSVGLAVINPDSFRFDHLFLLVISLGLINSFACYCQWRATDLNVTKTALFTQGDDILSMALAYFILHEGRLITLPWGIGIGLIMAAAIVFVSAPVAIPKEVKESVKPVVQEQLKHNDKAIWKWVMGYNLGWGATSFMFRWLGIMGLGLYSFLPAWYGGSFIGSLFVLFFFEREKEPERLTLKSILPVLLLSWVVWVSLGLSYRAFTLAEVLKVRPIFQMGQVITPLLIGLLVFKELKGFTKQGKTAMAVGLLGTLLIFYGS